MNVVETTDGARIAWSEAGAGRPVLLVMGLGADSSAWKTHVRSFAGSMRCLMLDNRGVGGSDAPAGPYSTARMAEDCVSVLDAAGVGSAAVVGISMGGAIAQELAILHPERVDHLVLVSSWAACSPVSEQAFEELRTLRSAVTPSELLRRLQLLIWAPESFNAAAVELSAERVDASFSMSEEAFSAQIDACLRHDTVNRLAQIRARTLVTVGDLDVFTPPSSSHVLAREIGGARLEIFDGAGHAHHWEQLEKFNRLCEEFIHES